MSEGDGYEVFAEWKYLNWTIFFCRRLNGSQLKAIFHITLGRILKATVILKGLMIEWVVVKGYNEEGNGDSEAEIWKESDHLVFRKITENANAAMLNFNSPIYPEFSLKSFIVRWLPFFCWFM